MSTTARPFRDYDTIKLYLEWQRWLVFLRQFITCLSRRDWIKSGACALRARAVLLAELTEFRIDRDSNLFSVWPLYSLLTCRIKGYSAMCLLLSTSLDLCIVSSLKYTQTHKQTHTHTHRSTEQNEIAYWPGGSYIFLSFTRKSNPGESLHHTSFVGTGWMSSTLFSGLVWHQSHFL